MVESTILSDPRGLRRGESADVSSAPAGHEVSFVTVHGHRRAFVTVGSGPPLLLLHGLACDHTTWDPVLDRLAETHTVIAPDLLGHGASAKPRADYSVGGYANGMRDLLTVLGVDRATVVGHSFGGGVAMQFAYQYPERTSRVMLVASGGLGPEVTPVLKAVTLPGFPQAVGLATLPGVRELTTTGLRLLSRTGLPMTRDLDEVARIVETFRDPLSRSAIHHVVRSVVDWRGQIVTLADRAYLTGAMPMCLVWGDDDAVIPVGHLANAAALAPGIRTEVIADAGHFPHKDHPDVFCDLLLDFVATTQPARHSRARFRAMLKHGASEPVVTAEAGKAPVSPLEGRAGA